MEMFPVVSLISQAVRREVRLPNETCGGKRMRNRI